MDNVPTKDKLQLGCGKNIKPDFINVDLFPFEGVDVVADITKGLPFPDNSFSLVFSEDFLEHINPERKVWVINEIWRVLKPDGTMEHYIPNAGSRNDFGSPSHLSHWNLQQFEHFDVNSYRYRVDHDYEGFIGKFEKVLAEEISPLLEYFGYMPQSIHVIYKALKNE